MKSKLKISAYIFPYVMITLLTGCTRASYERLEESSLPRYQQGVLVMSNIVKVCKRITNFELGNFKISRDALWDQTIYPTPPTYPPRYEDSWCQNGEDVSRAIDLNKPLPSMQKARISYRDDEIVMFSECISYSEMGYCREYGEKEPNTDPSKGALKAWPLGGITMDGLNWKSKMITFSAILVEGDKTPLGGSYSGIFNVYNKDTDIIEKLSINNREWVHLQKKLEIDSTRPSGVLGNTTELYKTKIGNYTLLIMGDYSYQITNNPDWLAKRQAFLREWIESFKIEPLPADYKSQ